MASVTKKDIPQISMFMTDFWELVKRYWKPDNTDPYWESVIRDTDKLYGDYADDFCHKMLLSYIEYLDEKAKKERE